jgi:hypothetical protein
MDIKSTLIVFGILTVSGILVSLMSSRLQCSKTGFTTSLTQGTISAVLPTIVFAAAQQYEMIRGPFIRTFESFGVSPEKSGIMGVGYLVMLTAWVSTVWNIHNTEKIVCNTSLKEMTEFKKKLLVELQEKEAAKEKNAQKS